MSVQVLSHSREGTLVFEKVRVVEKAANGHHFIDVKFAATATVWMYVEDNLHEQPWIPEAWTIKNVADGVPGYDVRIFNVDKLALVGDSVERFGVSRGGLVYVQNAIRGGQAGALRVNTGNGYVDLGPKNASLAHFETDRPAFYMNTGLRVNTGSIGSYDEDLYLSTKGTSRVQISQSTGNVGVAYAPDATYRLKVNGAVYANTNVIAGGAVQAKGIVRTDNWFQAKGGFGINWDNDPGGGSGDDAYIQYLVETGENTKLRIGIGNDADDDIEFWQLGAARMNIYNGNVGIGYTTPDWKLKVAGTGYFSSNLRTDGTFEVAKTSYFKGNVGILAAASTNASYGLNMGKSIHMNNQAIDYVSQLHFNDNVRFYDDGNDNYLNFKYNDTGTGAIRFIDGGNKTQGYLMSDGHSTYSSFGLRDADNNWAVRVYDDQFTALYQNGNEKLRADSAGVDITGNLTVTGSITPGACPLGMSKVGRICYTAYQSNNNQIEAQKRCAHTYGGHICFPGELEHISNTTTYVWTPIGCGSDNYVRYRSSGNYHSCTDDGGKHPYRCCRGL